MSNTKIAEQAIEYVLRFETKNGHSPVNVSRDKKHSGYDILSGKKKIEVKGKIENWSSYDWQVLYKSEIRCLQENPDNFFLYIVKFKRDDMNQVEDFFIIPGTDLIKNFKVQPETFRLSPISQSRLKQYRQ